MPSTPDDWLEDETSPQGWSFWNPGTGAAVKSFWLGCSGLAVLAHATALASVYVSKVLHSWLLDRLVGSLPIAMLWRSLSAIEQMVCWCLVPSMTLLAALPILCWRGSFGWRCTIALTLIVSVLCFVSDSLGYVPRVKLVDELNDLSGLISCWLAVPGIFLCPPFNRLWQLRLVAGLGLTVILVSLLLNGLERIPPAMYVVSWLILFPTAIIATLFFRNAGRLATLEKTATEADIQRLSSATLMELMGLAGVLCALIMFWTGSFDLQRVLAPLAVALAVGVTTPFSAGLSLARWWRAGSQHTRRYLFLSWLCCSIIFGAASAFLVDWTYNGSWAIFFSPQIATTAFASGMLGSLALHLYGMLCIGWLKYCGWSLPKNR